MNPRKIRSWAGRVLLAAGIALGVLLGVQAAAAADPEWSSVTSMESSEGGSFSIQQDPEWS